MQKASFGERVRAVVAGIPKGSVLTYGQVAKKAGNERAARAVGTIMRQNFDPNVPCHRVVRGDGVIGQYNRGGMAKKSALLAAEGVRIISGKVAWR